jgi:DNA-directed RNA polymerase alpha subunit
MSATQTKLKKIETNARKRLEETKIRLKEFLAKREEQEPDVEIEASEVDDWEYS